MTDPREAVPDSLLDMLLAHVPAAVIVHDLDLKIVRTNEAFHQMTGHGNEVLGKSPFEFVPEPLLNELGLKEKLPRVRDEGAVIGPEEICYRTPDGRPVVFMHKAFPVRGADGTVAFVVTLLQDWTAHAQLVQHLKEMMWQQETQLKEAADTRKAMLFMLEDLNENMASIVRAKKQWEATFDAIADPLFIHDAEFRIVQANRAYCAAAAGLPRAKVIGRSYYEVFPVMKGPCQVCQRAGELHEEEVFVSASGQTYRMWAYPLRDVAEGACTIHIMEDITERKMMETQAKRLERLAAMGQLLGGIAHEVRNPVFILTSRLQLLREKLASREYDQVASDLLKIEEAAQRITLVVQRFLTLAKPSNLNVGPCLVQEVLQEISDFLANECLRQHVRVDTSWPSTLPPVLADRHQLDEAFMNLMLNAIQAMAAAHGGGTLTISAQLSAVSPYPAAQKQGGPWIEVRIQDDGPGIAPEHRAKLFEPFFSTKPPEQGTGLGLWIVRTFVMTFQGTVDYETDVGRGTTFIVRLPVLSPVQPGTNNSPAG